MVVIVVVIVIVVLFKLHNGGGVVGLGCVNFSMGFDDDQIKTIDDELCSYQTVKKISSLL